MQRPLVTKRNIKIHLTFSKKQSGAPPSQMMVWGCVVASGLDLYLEKNPLFYKDIDLESKS